MRKIFFLIALSLLASCTDLGSTDTYTYTVRNESGVIVKVLAYNSFSSTPEEVIFTTILENEDEITKIYKDGLPPRSYKFSDFFGKSNGASVSDSIKVIYNNTKFKIFIPEINCSVGIRNPLNTCIYSDTEEIFIFTEQDYENAKPCNGNCE